MSLNLVQLTEVVAAALEYPLPSAMLAMRFGRETELLTHGGRGRNVPKATSADAAYLLTALIASPGPARAVEYMKAFGDLRLYQDFSCFGGDHASFVEGRFPTGTTFNDALASTIDLLADREFAATFPIEEWEGKGFSEIPDDPPPLPVIDVSYRDTELAASIAIGGSRLSFHHAALQSVGFGRGTREELKAAVAESGAAASMFSSKIKSERRIESDVLAPIAAALHGVRFVDLLRDLHLGAAGAEEAA